MVAKIKLILYIMLACGNASLQAQGKAGDTPSVQPTTEKIPIVWSQDNIKERPNSTKITIKWTKRTARKLQVVKEREISSVNAERKIRRVIVKKCEDTYDFNSTQHKEIITDIRYTFEEPEKPHSIDGSLDKKVTFRDIIPTDVLKTEVIKVQPETINFEVQNQTTSRIDRMAFYLKYRNEKQPRVYFEGSVEPAISIRTLFIKQEQLGNQSSQDQRSRNEKSRTVLSWKGRVGFQLDMSSSLYLDYSIMKQGFKSYHRIDWTTGLPLDTVDKIAKYYFKSHSLGLGYSYSPFRVKRASFTSDVGFIFNIAQKGLSQEFKNIGIGSRIAAGVKLTVVPCFDIRIMPNWVANFQRLRHEGNTDSRHEIIGTRMQAFGLSVSTRWYPMIHKR